MDWGKSMDSTFAFKQTSKALFFSPPFHTTNEEGLGYNFLRF